MTESLSQKSREEEEHCREIESLILGCPIMKKWRYRRSKNLQLQQSSMAFLCSIFINKRSWSFEDWKQTCTQNKDNHGELS